MKFIKDKQFSDYFYNHNENNTDKTDSYILAHARDIFIHLQKEDFLKQPILFLIGPGKNGKLALEVARLCTISQIRVHLFIAQSTPSERDIRAKFRDYMTFVQIYSDLNSPRFDTLFQTVELIVDGLFATGISSSLDAHYTSIIEHINKNIQCDVLSLIIPSGMKEKNNTYIHATHVVTVEQPLLTLYLHDFPIDHIICVPSTQAFMEKQPPSHIFSTIPEHFKPTLTSDSHKYNRGFILSFGGIDYFGSSVLTLKAMTKINACMIHHFSDIDSKYPLLTQIPEIIFRDIQLATKAVHQYASTPTCALMGFGTNYSALLLKHFKHLLNLPYFFPIILDAGGIDLLKHYPQYRTKSDLHPIIITPHLGEFSRLVELPLETLKQDKLNIAQTFAKEHSLTLVLKGSQTLVTNGVTTWINPSGNPLLATPGSGDVLAGTIASHFDQTTHEQTLFSRVCEAVYRHAHAADKLLEKENITASMLIEAL